MSRKPFILVTTLMAVVLLMAGSGSAAPAQPANVLQPMTLTVAWAGDISTLDPALAYDSASLQVISNLYDTLVRLDPADSGQVLPGLATDWAVSSNGLTYTFDIRWGTGFHDQTMLQPKDIAYSLQRGLLQSDPNSPQWLLLEPIMGVSDITENIAGGQYVGDPLGLRDNADPLELLAVCQEVKDRIRSDDAAGTVTIDILSPDGSFLPALSTYGWILNSDWAKAQGDWDGDCATWQNFYAPTAAEGSRLSNKANGSGPFSLFSFIPGTSIQLTRNATYWRPRPQSAVPLETVLIKTNANSDDFPFNLTSGQLDFAAVRPDQQAALDGQVMLEYTPGAAQPILRNPTGSLAKLSGIVYPSAPADIFLNFDIATDGPRNYIGSGQFDGNGIPANFFSDIHVRKAFAYAFDYDAFNDGVFEGSGLRRTGPIVKPLMGYADGQPTYDYNLTQAAQEMALAWGGQVAAQGFKMTIAYSQGSTSRRLAANLLKTGIESLDPKYQIEVIELAWNPDYLQDQRAGRLPLFAAGWIQDYPDPNNWVEPYLWGTYAQRQNLPDVLRLDYQQQGAACLAQSGGAALACYEALQVQAYQDTATIYTFQQTISQYYASSEVSGLGQAISANSTIDYSQLWKGGSPIAGVIDASYQQGMGTRGSSGIRLDVTFPTGSLATPRVMLVQPDVPADQWPAPNGLRQGKLTFALSDWDVPTSRTADLIFASPAEVKITYEANQIIPLIEEDLVLMRHDGDGWVEAACGEINHDLDLSELVVPVCQTGDFALMGTTNAVAVPAVLR